MRWLGDAGGWGVGRVTWTDDDRCPQSLLNPNSTKGKALSYCKSSGKLVTTPGEFSQDDSSFDQIEAVRS